MTTLTEDRCRSVMETLCAGMGWEIAPVPGVPYVMFAGTKCVTFGMTWRDLFLNFCNDSYGFAYRPPEIPSWARECSSPEEMAFKIEICCGAR